MEAVSNRGVFLTRRDLRLADQEPTEAVGFSAD